MAMNGVMFDNVLPRGTSSPSLMPLAQKFSRQYEVPDSVKIPNNGNPNNIPLKPRNLPALRDNAARYARQAFSETDANIVAGALQSSRLYYVTADMIELAVNVLNTTGVQDEWAHYVPEQAFVIWEKPFAEMTAAYFYPQFAAFIVENEYGLPELRKGGVVEPGKPEVLGSLLDASGKCHSFMFANADMMHARAEYNVRVVEDFARTLHRDYPLEVFDKRVMNGELASMKQASRLSTSLLPAAKIEGAFLPPKFRIAYGDEERKRIRDDAKRLFPAYDGMPGRYCALVLAAAIALSREEGIGEERRIDAGRKKRNNPGKQANAGTDVSILSARSTGRAGAPNGEHHRNHRWIVSGHYRNQPYGPGRKQHKTIWIAPYIAGPEDKPLIIRDKVNVI